MRTANPKPVCAQLTLCPREIYLNIEVSNCWRSKFEKTTLPVSLALYAIEALVSRNISRSMHDGQYSVVSDNF